MCGRYTLRASPQELAEYFAVLREAIQIVPRWNISPTQMVPAVRQRESGSNREWSMVRWGLIPSWAKDEKIAYSLLNARSETLAEKPSFRTAYKKRRCLLPTDGYYEWSVVEGEKLKQPWLYELKNHQPFAFAGLWESWTNPAGKTIESCSIITTQANELAAPIHDRMPVILDPADFDQWLNPRNQDVEELQSLLIPFPAKKMTVEQVSTSINKAGVELDPRIPAQPQSPRKSGKSTG